VNVDAYPVARYRFTFEVTKPFYIPDYAGSMLRGMFGWSLKKLSVASKFGDLISKRDLYKLCPYTMLFDPPPPEEHKIQKFSNIPAPYVIEPPDWGTKDLVEGERLQFNMVLAGHARHQLPYIIAAWQGALAENIGREQGSAELVEVECMSDQVGERVYHREASVILDHTTATQMPKEPSPVGEVRVKTLTPMRVQRDGKPLSAEDISARAILMALIRRVGLITEFHTNVEFDTDYSTLGELAEQVTIEKSLEWQDWRRYSSRQKQKMSFGGVVGSMVFKGDLGPFLPYLFVGQWLHVGKNATFGLGNYEIL
jgi:hypothetical protein